MASPVELALFIYNRFSTNANAFSSKLSIYISTRLAKYQQILLHPFSSLVLGGTDFVYLKNT